MLKNLVKKFKSHTLNEDDSSPDERQQPPDAVNGGAVAANDYASPLPPPPLTTRAHALHRQQSALYANNTGDCQRRTNHRCQHHQQQQRQHQTRGACSSRKPPCCCLGSSRAQAAAAATLYNNGDGGSCSSGSKHGRAPSVGSGRNGQAASADDKDSGTESDEELARAETNSSRSFPFSQTSDYYASQQSLSASCRSSHCGSPLFGGFSDQECNSLDSVGCESGIGLRSNDFACCDLLETPTPPELPNHHYHTRQQFQRFLKQQIQQISSVNGHLSIEPVSAGLVQCVSAVVVPTPNGAACAAPCNNNVSNSNNERALTLPTARVIEAVEENDRPKGNGFTEVKCKSSVRICMPKKVSSPGALSGSSVDELEEINGEGDCATVARLAKDGGVASNQICKVDNIGSDKLRGRTSCQQQQQQTDNPAPIYSEKRKWSQVRGSVSSGFHNQSSNGIINNNNTNIVGNELRSNIAAERYALTAARKTPIKLLIPLTRNATDSAIGAEGATSAPAWDLERNGEKLSPRKKCRPSVVDEESAGEVISNEDPAAASMLSRRCRPSLNFEKMREKLAKRSRRKRQHCVNTAMKAKLRGWTPSYQLRSFRSDFLFQPLELQQQVLLSSPPSPSSPQHQDNSASSSNSPFVE